MEDTNLDFDQISVISGTTDGSLNECLPGKDLHVLSCLYDAERVSPVFPCQDFNLASSQHNEKTSPQDLGLSEENRDWMLKVRPQQEDENTDCCRRDVLQSRAVKYLNNFRSQVNAVDITSQGVVDQVDCRVTLSAVVCSGDHGADRYEGHSELTKCTAMCSSDFVVDNSSERLGECGRGFDTQKVPSVARVRTTQKERYSSNLESVGLDEISEIGMAGVSLGLLGSVGEGEERKSVLNTACEGNDMKSVLNTACEGNGMKSVLNTACEGNGMKSVLNTSCEGNDMKTVPSTTCEGNGMKSVLNTACEGNGMKSVLNTACEGNGMKSVLNTACEGNGMKTVSNTICSSEGQDMKSVPKKIYPNEGEDMKSVPNRTVIREGEEMKSVPNRTFIREGQDMKSVPNTTFTSEGQDMKSVPNTTFTSEGQDMKSVPNTTFISEGQIMKSVPNTTFISEGQDMKSVPNTTFISEGQDMKSVPNTTFTIEGQDMKSVPNTAFTSEGQDMKSVPNKIYTGEGQDRECVPNKIYPSEGQDMECVPNKIYPSEGQDMECVLNKCPCEVDIMYSVPNTSPNESPDIVITCSTASPCVDLDNLVHTNIDAQVASNQVMLDDSQRDLFESQALSEGRARTQLSMTSPLIFDEDDKQKCASDVHSCCSDQLRKISDKDISSSKIQMNCISQQAVSSSDLQMEISCQGSSSLCPLNTKVSEQRLSSSDCHMKVFQQNCSSRLQIKDVSEQGTRCSYVEIKDASVQQDTSCSDVQVKDISFLQGKSSLNLQIKDVSVLQGMSSSHLQVKDVSVQQKTNSSDIEMNDTHHQEMNCCAEMFNLTSHSPLNMTTPKQAGSVFSSEKEELKETVKKAEDDNCSTASHSTLPPRESPQQSFQVKESPLPCTSLVSEREDRDKMATNLTRVGTVGSDASSQDSKASSLLLNCPSLEGSDEADRVGKVRPRHHFMAATADVKTSKASSHKRKVQSVPASGQRQLPQNGMLKKVTDGLVEGAQANSDLTADRTRHGHKHSLSMADEKIPTDAKTLVIKNRLSTDRMKVQSTGQPKVHNKELQRLVDLYDKMLDKVTSGRVVDGKSQLQKFEQIVHKLRATHECYRARLLSSVDRKGVAWQRQWQHMLDNQAMLAVAWDKHQLLEQRVQTVQAGGLIDKLEGISQLELQTSSSVGHPCSHQDSSSSLQEFSSSAKQYGATGSVFGKDRSGAVRLQLCVSECQTTTKKEHTGTHKVGDSRVHVEGNSSRNAEMQRNGGTESCLLTMNSETKHLRYASAAVVGSISQTKAFQEGKQHPQCLHETTRMEAQQPSSHYNVTLQPGSDIGENGILQPGSHDEFNIEKDRVFNDDSHISEDVLSLHDDSDIGETVMMAAEEITKRYSTLGDVGHYTHDRCAAAVDKGTGLPEVCEMYSGVACNEQWVEGSGGKHLLQQGLRMQSTDCLSGKVKIISGQAPVETRSTAPRQDQQLHTIQLRQEGEIIPALTSNRTDEFVMAGRTCFRKLRQQPQAEQMSVCLADIGVSGTDRGGQIHGVSEHDTVGHIHGNSEHDTVGHIHGVSEIDTVGHIQDATSQSQSCKKSKSLGVVSSAVFKKMSGYFDGTEAGDVKAQSTRDRLPAQTPSSSLSDQLLSQTLAWDANGEANMALAQDVDNTPRIRQLANSVTGDRFQVVDDSDTTKIDVGVTHELLTGPATRELTDSVTGNRFQVVDDRDTTLVEVDDTHEVQCIPTIKELTNRVTGNRFQAVDRDTTTTVNVGPTGMVHAETATRTEPGTTTKHRTEPGTTTEHRIVPGTTTKHRTVTGTTTEHRIVPGEHKIVPGTTTEHRIVPGTTTEHRIVPGTTTEHRTVPGATTEHRIVPGTNTEHRIVPGTTTKHRMAPGTTTEHRIVPGTTTEHRIVPGTTTEHRIVPGTTTEYRAVPCITDIEDRAVLDRTDFEHREIPGTVDSEHRALIVPRTTSTEQRLIHSIIGCHLGGNSSDTAMDKEVTLPKVVDSCHPEMSPAAGSTSLPAYFLQGRGVVPHTVVTHGDQHGVPASQTSKQKVHKLNFSFPSNIRNKPASPASTASSSLFHISSKEAARGMGTNVLEKLSFTSQSQVTQTSNTNLHYQAGAAAKPGTSSIFGLPSVNAKNLNLVTKTSPVEHSIVDLTSAPNQATTGVKQMVLNVATASCQSQVTSHSRNQAARGRRGAATSNCRKRGRPRNNNPAGNQGKKARSGQLTSTSHQGQIQHYFPLQFVTSGSGSATNSCTNHGSATNSCTNHESATNSCAKHGSVTNACTDHENVAISCTNHVSMTTSGTKHTSINTSLPTSQSQISVNSNTGTRMDPTKKAPEFYPKTNKIVELSTSEQSSGKSSVMVDVSALINNLRTVLLIADEEVTNTRRDFPSGFWDEDFTKIRVSESVWKSLDDW